MTAPALPQYLWLRPESQVYYYRRAVPEGLRALVGKTMMQISLDTKNLAVAKRKLAPVKASVAAQWRALARDAAATPVGEELIAVSIGTKDAVALAGEVYSATLARNKASTLPAAHWEKALAEIQPALPEHRRASGTMKGGFGGVAGRAWIVEKLLGHMIDELLLEKGITVTGFDRQRVGLQVVSALAQAYEVLARNASGDYSPDPRAGRFPPKVDFRSWRKWYDEYCIAKVPEPASRKRQLGVLEAFFEFMGHDRPALVEKADVIAWMEKRLRVVSHRTVRTADLAHPRAFFAWCKATDRLPSNPFLEVHVPRSAANKRAVAGGGAQLLTKKRGYSMQEARTVLAATLVAPGGRMSKHGAAARRWIPWLCAYTGARVGEMAQLRKSDVKLGESEDGTFTIWVLRITPEAGRVKDYEAREVAIHPHLLEQGFLDFVEASKTETLFYDVRRARGGSAANPQSAKAGERLAAWIRGELRIADPSISPNHAWRHRFRSQLRNKVATEVLDAIDGHAPRTEGEDYGTLYPEASLAAVSLIPAYRFDGACDRPSKWTRE